jgi:hypothetical protein
MDCLCLIDSILFTFVYVNDGRIHGETFDHRWHGLFRVQAGGPIEIIEVDRFIEFSQDQTTTKEPQ